MRSRLYDTEDKRQPIYRQSSWISGLRPQYSVPISYPQGNTRGAFKRIEMIDSSSESHFYDQQFVDAIEFMLKASTLVFCDQGGSRAPSVALLYMSVCGDISNASYFDACRKFRTIYPWYKPNTGIRTFLANNWHSLQLSLPHRQP